MIPARSRRLGAGVLATVLTFAWLVNGATPLARAEGPDDAKILLMLDASGSMKEKDPSGLTKLAAAKKALTSAVDSLPDTAAVGLRVYGATINEAKPTKASCQDTQLVHPINALDKPGLKQAIGSFDAKGDTPISYSLLQGAKDLGDQGQRHIVLVSDGEETCVKDPCAEVKKIVGQGISLQIDTVGFDVNAKAREQLRCIADAGNGTYYDAHDAGDLDSALRRLATRAARPFTVSGTPVIGTPEPEQAPELVAGQYTDKADGSSQGDIVRYYRIKRSIPGSSLHVSTLTRMPLAAGVGHGGWEYDLTTTDGDHKCDHTWDLGNDGAALGVIAAGSVAAYGLDPKVNASSADSDIAACAQADELLFALKRTAGSRGTAKTELRVIEEPPATNAADLPAGVATVPKANSTKVKSPAYGTPKSVIGGASFNDALDLSSGTYVTEIVPGERVFFSTPIDWGQDAVFSIDGPAKGFAGLKAVGMGEYILLSGDVFAPDFSRIDSNENNYAAYPHGSTTASSPDRNEVPSVRYRNRWDSPKMFFDRSRGFAMAGRYYYSVAVARESAGAAGLKGVPIPVVFSFKVKGQVSGVPQFETGGASASPTDAGSASTPDPTASGPQSMPNYDRHDQAPVLPLVGGTLVLLAVVGGVAYLMLRRRR